MNRARFVGAAAAATLAGCSGHGAGLIPTAAKPSASRAAATFAGNEAETRLAALTLSHPIIGEMGTYTGATIPSGWMLADGQVMDITQNRPLFSILGSAAGGDGKTTFGIPTGRGAQWIIAIAGTFPSSPQVIANLGRSQNFASSLGIGAHPAPPKPAAQPPADVLAQRTLLASNVAPPQRVPADLDAATLGRYRAADADARTQSLGALSAESAAHLNSLIADAIAGRRSVGDASKELAGSLTASEASSLLAVHDSAYAAFRTSGPSVHQNPNVEAAQFLMSVAFTPDQVDAMMSRENP